LHLEVILGKTQSFEKIGRIVNEGLRDGAGRFIVDSTERFEKIGLKTGAKNDLGHEAPPLKSL